MTVFKANRKFPNPITVTDDPKSHTLALQQVIEALSIGQRRTREIGSSYVRVQELVDVGLIEIVGNQLKLTNLGESVAAGGATALSDLTDVDLTGLADGDTLVWNSATSKWEPGTGGGTSVGYDEFYHPDVPPTTPESEDDEFDGTVLDTSKWTWRNQGDASAAVREGYLVMTADTTASNTLNILEQTVSGSWKFRAKVALSCTGRNYAHSGIAVVNTANGRVLSFHIAVDSSNNHYLQVHRWNSVTSYNSNPLAVSSAVSRYGGTDVGYYLEVECNGTNLYFRSSGNGVSYVLHLTEALTTFISAVDRIGLMVIDSSAATPRAEALFQWFRKIGGSYAPGKLAANLSSTGGGGGGSGFTPSDMYDAALSDLSDVSIYMPRDGDVLTYNATLGVWEAGGRASYPDDRPFIPNAMDDEFDDGVFNTTLWTAAAPYDTYSTPPTISEVSSLLMIDMPNSGDVIAYEQPCPSGAFKFRAKVRMVRTTSHGDTITQYMNAGIFVARDAASKICVNTIERSPSYITVGANRRTGTTFNTTSQQNLLNYLYTDLVFHGLYLELEGDGTNLYFRYSLTGLEGTYELTSSETYASHLGGAPDKVGFVCGRGGSTNRTLVLYDWFRRVA